MLAHVGLLLALLLAAPPAAAHLEHDRPSIQEFQPARLVQMERDDGGVRIDLLRQDDPQVQLVRYRIDPGRARWEVEHRAHASEAEGAFRTQLVPVRILEYRDVNKDLRYDPEGDAPLRSWRLDQYTWSMQGPQDVAIAGRSARSAAWNGTFPGGPAIRVEAVAAGAAYVDEGARVLPQDILLFVDLRDLPPRAAGNLFLVEWRLHAPSGAQVRLDGLGNVTTGALVEAPARLAHLTWGGQAVVDGAEVVVDGVLADQDDEPGRLLRIHLPASDQRARFAVVMGVEHGPPRESPAPPFAWLAAALAGAALTRRRAR